MLGVHVVVMMGSATAPDLEKKIREVSMVSKTDQEAWEDLQLRIEAARKIIKELAEEAREMQERIVGPADGDEAKTQETK